VGVKSLAGITLDWLALKAGIDEMSSLRGVASNEACADPGYRGCGIEKGALASPKV
jgi:hypothetical protein